MGPEPMRCPDCNSKRLSGPDHEGFYDCLDCGAAWDPSDDLAWDPTGPLPPVTKCAYRRSVDDHRCGVPQPQHDFFVEDHEFVPPEVKPQARIQTSVQKEDRQVDRNRAEAAKEAARKLMPDLFKTLNDKP